MGWRGGGRILFEREGGMMKIPGDELSKRLDALTAKLSVSGESLSIMSSLPHIWTPSSLSTPNTGPFNSCYIQ